MLHNLIILLEDLKKCDQDISLLFIVVVHGFNNIMDFGMTSKHCLNNSYS